jgi:hypothetical protein
LIKLSSLKYRIPFVTRPSIVYAAPEFFYHIGSLLSYDRAKAQEKGQVYKMLFQKLNGGLPATGSAPIIDADAV